MDNCKLLCIEREVRIKGKLYYNCLTVNDFILLCESARLGILPKLQIAQALKNCLYSAVAKKDYNVDCGYEWN